MGRAGAIGRTLLEPRWVRRTNLATVVLASAWWVTGHRHVGLEIAFLATSIPTFYEMVADFGQVARGFRAHPRLTVSLIVTLGLYVAAMVALKATEVAVLVVGGVVLVACCIAVSVVMFPPGRNGQRTASPRGHT